MISSDLRRHCNHFSIFFKFFTWRVPTASHTAYYWMYTHWHPELRSVLLHAIKYNHKSTATSPSTVIAAVDNHYLPPLSSLELLPSPPPSIPSLSSISGVTRRFHIPIHEGKSYILTIKARRIHRPTRLPQTTDPSHSPPQHLCLQILPCHESPGLIGGPAHLYQWIIHQ